MLALSSSQFAPSRKSGGQFAALQKTTSGKLASPAPKGDMSIMLDRILDAATDNLRFGEDFWSKWVSIRTT